MKKKIKMLLGIVLALVLIIVGFVIWEAGKITKIQHESIDDDHVGIAEPVKESTETGVMKGYWNIALFGVDSRDGELNKNTRTDTMLIASINLDTKEVRLVSVYRDTFLNIGNDTYDKANAAYAKGGASQAIEMLNTNFDLNITDFITVGFEGIEDLIDAIGGVEVDVKEKEIIHLNNYQICISGEEDGTLNAAGEPNYVATEGVDYHAVTKAGLQKLNGLQATAYCRIRYVGNDFERTQRQRNVIEQITKKISITNPMTIDKIAETVIPKTATSLDFSEAIKLLGGTSDYYVGKASGFPFENLFINEKIDRKSCIVPNTLEENVIELHHFLFDEEDYVPSDVVKENSQYVENYK